MVNGRIIVSNLDPNGGTVVAGILYPASGPQLDANPLKQAEPLCRCQNSYQSRTITTEALPPGNPGVIAHVVLDFGAGRTARIDVTVLQTPNGWFASDTSCTGQDPGATSIYAASPPPCS